MLYLLDLDDTLIKGYLSLPDKDYHAVEVLPGRRECLAKLVKDGHRIAIATNQGGIAFGYNSVDDYERKIAASLEQLGLTTDTPVAVCFSDVRGKAPWNDQADAARRKPSGAMIRELMEQVGAKPANTMFIGDRPEDEQAAAAAGIGFMWADEFFRVAG